MIDAQRKKLEFDVGKVQKVLLVLEKIMFQRGSFAYGICHTIVLRSMRLRGNEEGDERNI